MSVIEELMAALGNAVLTGDRITERYRSDASLSGRTLPLAVVRPGSVDEVAVALKICNAHGQCVVPQGGLTGLAGGANPRAGDIAVSLERLSGIEEVDATASSMTVLAGTPLEVAQRAAEDAGFLLPIDLGARGSCQIGGNLATNAGGIRVIRNGVARDNVLGLEAVLADGTVVSSMNKMIKNNTGYDLRQLFIGSEGTLGIITRAVLRLRPLPTGRLTALCALDSYSEVVTLLKRAQQELPGLGAYEAMWESYFRFNSEADGLRLFESCPAFAVIVEQDLQGHDAESERFEAFLGRALENGVIGDALVAQSQKEAQAFWRIREGHALDRLPLLLNFDVSLAIGDIGRFADECGQALRAKFPEAHVSFFGHVGDSNLHIAFSDPGATEETIHVVDDIVYALVGTYRGSVSAEHGIGLLKRDFLHYSRSPAELELMRRIKNALDPNGILNPGKVLGSV
ncbi:FAD-binding protein [Sinorhizobium medicae]|uniref:FAD-binding protein n=1 Tax=Sinorhizobium medicae TaxID=110321 RepID=A0A6G1WS23_9HYPH|nr:FAD-binding oxidoreductase [Sinorhizobium medicae]MBO1941624.1 FAD-binding oxidoreductase [Sinorhizobium medicae]MDX0403836.1 FAD-binding protein [Sinorhizobium medicae]MDX0413785.1 FAD-binding protein [Sinorhizobium medicae]MDX0415275.1 FAD-binding protein [Sinorhizobium medicae]MDX0421257.1 FAD-binding protein [Sinorhizobium medicae]